MGAKNHAIILPDADRDATLNALIAAGFGAAGQRCMALSTAVFVGGSESWYNLPYLKIKFSSGYTFLSTFEVSQLTILLYREEELVKRASGLVVNSGMVNDADLGPVISRQVCLWTSSSLMLFTLLQSWKTLGIFHMGSPAFLPRK